MSDRSAQAAEAYAVMPRTPRGGALPGRPTRVRESEFSPRFVALARLAIVAVVLTGFLGSRLLDDGLFPYAGTVAGAVVGGVLIIFGRSLRQALNSLAMRGNGLDGTDGMAHGSR
jgi:hypothetical protein